MKLYEKYKSLFSAYHVNTPLRLAHFFAQMHAESGLKAKRERLYYRTVERARMIFKTPFKDKSDEFVNKYLRNTKKMANYVYANRMGNGDEASGEGFKYRGGGFNQITGKNNYLLLSKDTYIDFINFPELIEEENYALISALWYWSRNNLNRYADLDDLDAISDIINIGSLTIKEGDSNGYEHRKKWLEHYKKVFNAK